MTEAQAQIDARNADFWDELCGTAMAQELGITDASPESLEIFDRYYLDAYPYLDRYLPGPEGEGKRLLEIGLGYGTVSQILAERGSDYHGLDIAAGPVEMVRDRIARLGLTETESRVVQGSALENPFPDEHFDYVVAIGCLHHTGDLAGAIEETRRVLRPGGKLIGMVYNRRSYRRAMRAMREAPRRIAGRGSDEEAMRGRYDSNAAGDAAPATEYLSVAEAREVFSKWSEVEPRKENFDGFAAVRGYYIVPRRFLLGWPAHRAGLDLYFTATK